MKARPAWLTTERYGNAAGAAAAFTALFLLAAYTVVDAAYLMSNSCPDVEFLHR